MADVFGYIHNKPYNTRLHDDRYDTKKWTAIYIKYSSMKD